VCVASDDEDEGPETGAPPSRRERNLHGQDTSFMQAHLRLLRRDATRRIQPPVPISRFAASLRWDYGAE